MENLLETAKSIAEQDFANREYVVCDGGSIDGTQNHLPWLGADCYISEPDNGIFDAMNKALKLCTGEYICFLNAGDTFFSSTILSSVADYIINNRNISFFYGDVYYPQSIRPYSLQPKSLTPFLLFRGTVCHQAWFLRADVYRKLNGFDPLLKYKGDYDVLLRVVHQLHEAYLHIPVCVVNYRGGGYSEKTYTESRMEFEQVRRRYISPVQSLLFFMLTLVLNPVKNNVFFQKLMARYSKWKAQRTWLVGKKPGTI
jgi:glycosyltransferase involved in cell wall biosynthesis